MNTHFKVKSARLRFAHGQTFVEFAMIALPLLLLLFGIIAFGDAIYTYSFVSDASRDAVRYAIVHGSHSLAPASNTDIEDLVVSKLHGISSDHLTVSTCWNPNNGDGDCPDPDSPDNDPGKVVSVTVTYDFQPLFGMPNVVLPLTSTSEMVISH